MLGLVVLYCLGVVQFVRAVVFVFFNVLKIRRSSGRTDVLKIAGSCVVLFGSLFVGSHNKEGQPLYWLDDNYLK